jgi:DNA polymerase III sliding clamp (beta) subunit (PCNA family)
VKITTENFNEALALAGRAAATSSSIDILKFARFTASAGEFTLACNNLTMYAEARGECGSGDMEFCVRVDRLQAAMATAGEFIDLSLKGQMLTWKSGSARYQMSTLSVADFPTPKRDHDPMATLEDPAIAENLKRVVFSCATRDIRAYLFGVLIECTKGEEVMLVATDGAKLAAFATETKAPSNARVILHRDSISALPDGAERVRIFRESAEFDYPNGLLIARTIDGAFPEWTRVMPHGKPAGSGTVDRKALLAAIKAALPFDDNASIRLLLAGDGMQIESATRSGELAEVGIPGAKGEGEVDAWFYSAAISPAIQAARGDTLTLNFGGVGQAVSFTDGPLRCVCMPSRR